MADEIINARVKQKVDTEDNWMLNPLILLEGEQGFVVDELGAGVNFKIGDGTKTFSELPYWINYYSDVVSHKILQMPNVSSAQNIPAVFNQNTNLYDVIVSNIGGGEVVLKIGITEGGSEVGEYKIGVGTTVLDIKEMFDAANTLYLSGFDGNTLSIIIIYFDYTERPVVPPTPGAGGSFRWPKGAVGMFMPVGVGHLEQCFDMITGLGVTGTLYENCQICDNRNTYLDMTESYAIGYKTGTTLGSQVGNPSNTYTLIKENLPNYNLILKYGFINQQRGDTGSRYNFTTQMGAGPSEAIIPLGGSSTPIDIRPKSRILIYFLAITD